MLKKQKSKLRLVGIASLILLSSACCTTEYIDVPVIVKIQVIEKPLLPTMTQEQEESMSQEVYEIVSVREETLIQYMIRRDKVLKAHNDKADREKPDN